MATKVTAKFVLERETKGAVRYHEVDAKGNALEMVDATIGTIYIRKNAFKGQQIPNQFTVNLDW